jgi:protein-L-isoaspartate(D-aspartate) O-methyltransferase
MSHPEEERKRMVRQQISLRGITDRGVLAAMLKVPRECFVSEVYQDRAYADTPLSIEEGQTISQPYIVALMALKAEIKPSDRVLEIGTGSGYAAAVLAQLAAQVYTMERYATLLHTARLRFEQLGYNTIHTRLGDGSQGWPEQAPFDAIIVSAAAQEVPAALCEQLALGGRLVIPVGPVEGEQRLLKVVRLALGDFRQYDLGSVQFVPLICGPSLGD